MPQLVMDEISTKTLPFLDRLLDDKNKMSSILEQTSGATLLRLVIAAVSRNVIHGGGIPRTHVIAGFLEEQIEENLSGNGELAKLSLSQLNEKDQRELLLVSITRYKFYDEPTIMKVS